MICITMFNLAVLFIVASVESTQALVAALLKDES